MSANDNRPLTEAQASAATAKAVIAIRQARGERVSQSQIAEAARADAIADLDAQHLKRWEATIGAKG
jgi:hypothetical protein